MSMTRAKIETSRAEALRFIASADEALAQLNREAEDFHAANKRRGEVVPDKPRLWASDHSYGSPASGALRRASMDLTRSLARLRKSEG